MIKEHECVVLLQDLPENSLKASTSGQSCTSIGRNGL